MSNYRDGTSLKASKLGIELLWGDTERDLQVNVGASQFGSPCDYCCATDLIVSRPGVYKHPINLKPESDTYKLGSTVGTAIHALLEERTQEKHPTWLSEYKVTIGEIPGYGVIKSTLDLYVPEHRWLIDWKTTSKSKLQNYKVITSFEPEKLNRLPSVYATDYATLRKYYGQTQVYAWALVNEGKPVDTVSMCFIQRDGLTKDQVWSYDCDYDGEYAEQVWNRINAIWQFLVDGGNVEQLEKGTGCYCLRG